MPPRKPAASRDISPEDYAARLAQIGTLSGGATHPVPQDALPEEIEGLELVASDLPPGSGPDFTVEGDEAVAEPAVVGGDSDGPNAPRRPPLHVPYPPQPAVSPAPAYAPDPERPHSPVLPPPAMPLASNFDANALAGQVIAALKAQGAPVTDGVIQGSIQAMMRNAQAGILKDVTVDDVVGTAVRLNMKHQAAESGAIGQEAATRAKVMAEPKIAWRHEKRFKITINGWVMIVPSNQLVMVPYSVHEVLQNAIAQEVVVKAMQLEMYNRMTGIPAPVEDPNLYEGFDDHNMRRVAW